jgi:hypothetical protein
LKITRPILPPPSSARNSAAPSWTFQRVLGPDCTVGRVEHMLGGARRCVYLIRKIG